MWMIVFGCFTDYSLGTVIIRLHVYYTDWFCWGVLVFVITKTKRAAKREGSLFSKLQKLRPLNLLLNLT